MLRFLRSLLLGDRKKQGREGRKRHSTDVGDTKNSVRSPNSVSSLSYLPTMWIQAWLKEALPVSLAKNMHMNMYIKSSFHRYSFDRMQ